MPTLLKPDRLSVRNIFSTDIDCALEEWPPDDRRCVRICLYLVIGWDNDCGTNDFHLAVITNDLRRHTERRQHSTMYIDEFDWPKLKNSILHVIAKCERLTWDESVDELRKRFAWEYEGMAGT